MKTNSFSLDTKDFADSANSTKRLAEGLADSIAKTDKAINALYQNWTGRGRNEFEKKYFVFERQIEDVRDGLWDLYEDIVTAEEAYIQADCDAAKQIAGKSSDY